MLDHYILFTSLKKQSWVLLDFLNLDFFLTLFDPPIFDVVGVPVMRDSEIMYAEDLQQEGSQCASSSSSSSHKGMDLLERDQVFSYSEP